ncbi:MAG: DUF401 family protein [Peptococcaceae bacterium]|jgi:integral membrane protein (TIGR00529 family)|nr:DUF401 family protein [Peptococcaceae bacterium]
MLIIFKMLAVLLVIVILLKRKYPFGNAMLVASLVLFLITNPFFSNLSLSLQKTISNPGTWVMITTLYFVMCLEYMLRTSGLLKDFTASARKIFRSDRVLLGFMPAFLGFLPSLGGAIFSAPLVKEAGARYKLSAEKLTALNYWFRHVWEYCNPIIPAILLGSELTGTPLSSLIGNQFIFTIAAIVIGSLILLTGKSYRIDDVSKTPKQLETTGQISTRAAIRGTFLAAGPILLNILLVALFDFNPVLSLGLVLSGMAVILKFNFAKLKKMFTSAIDLPMFWAVLNIFFFQQILENTGTTKQIVEVLGSSGIPTIAIIGLTSFIIGILVGSPQGFVAVSFPLAVALAPGNLDVIAVAYLAGISGTISSPAHLCLIVTLEYFKADFLKSLTYIAIAQGILLLFGLSYIFLF